MSPITLSPPVYDGTRIQACKPCALHRHPDWNDPPAWAYPLAVRPDLWDEVPAVVIIDQSYHLGGKARLFTQRIAMCESHAIMYLGAERTQEFLDAQKVPA